MVSDISDPSCTLILQGIEKTLYPKPYLPMIVIAHNRSKQFGRHLEILMERCVKGLILVANWLLGEFNQLSELERSQVLTLAVGRDLTTRDVYSIQVDNETGGYAAARHFYELCDQEIAVLRGSSEPSDSDRCWLGIQQFTVDAGLALDLTRVSQLSPSKLIVRDSTARLRP